MVRGSHPGGGEIFRSDPDPPWLHPTSCLMGTFSFLGVKPPGLDINHPHPSSAQVKERVELYLYSPFVPPWSVLGWNLPDGIAQSML
jgi:hypothetical protein